MKHVEQMQYHVLGLLTESRFAIQSYLHPRHKLFWRSSEAPWVREQQRSRSEG